MIDDETFGKMSAFPLPGVEDTSREQINVMAAYGADPGLNIQQFVWLSIFSAAVSDPDTSEAGALSVADKFLPSAIKRLKELS